MINNFGYVEYSQFQNEIEYSYFQKNGDVWEKIKATQYIENDVYIPNPEAIANIRKGKTPELTKDLFGNPILLHISTKFFDKSPPEAIRNSPVKFGSDIHPTTKFLSDMFQFNEEKDEIPKFRIHYMDIETLVDNEGFLEGWDAGPDKQGYHRGGVTLISSYDNIDDKTTIFGINPYTSTDPLPSNTQYIWCKDERGVLREYMRYLKSTDPDIMTAWNGIGYDFPYIINRLILHFGPKSLNHFGNGAAWIDNNKRKLYVRRISLIDYMVIYKKFELKPRRSYSLAAITEVEGIKIDGVGKIKYEGSIKNFYEKDWNKFVKYCIQDAKLVYEIENKKKLLETFILCCYTAGISFTQAASQDVSWMRIHDAAIYRYCKNIGRELPENGEVNHSEEQFSGAYVINPKPGIYNYVTIFDVNSLYPTCIRSLNISIETYRGQVKKGNIPDQRGPYQVEFYDPLYLSLGKNEACLLKRYNAYHKDKVQEDLGAPKKEYFETFEQLKSYLESKNYCIAANGAIFTKDFRGVIPTILDHLIDDRKRSKNLYVEYKEKYQVEKNPELKLKYKMLSERYNTIQMVKKIFANSLYGYIGTIYSRFYHRNLAEAVTATGQLVLKSTIHSLNTDYDKLINDIKKGNSYE